MSLRISERPILAMLEAGLLCLALAACGGNAPEGGNAAAPDSAAAQANADDDKAECAIGAGAAWARDCLVERGEGPGGTILTVRHPDGGFRRLKIVTDERGVIPADGAEASRIALIDDGRIELTVGQDRYRLPATIEAPKP